MRMKTIKTSRGFTLVEMMVTIAIIGILAGIAVPNILKYVCHSRAAEGTAGMQTIATALRVYHVRTGTFLLEAATASWAEIDVNMQPGRRYNYCAPRAGTPLVLNADINTQGVVANQCPAGDFVPAATNAQFMASGLANIDGDATLDIVFATELGTPRHATNTIGIAAIGGRGGEAMFTDCAD